MNVLASSTQLGALFDFLDMKGSLYDSDEMIRQRIVSARSDATDWDQWQRITFSFTTDEWRRINACLEEYPKPRGELSWMQERVVELLAIFADFELPAMIEEAMA